MRILSDRERSKLSESSQQPETREPESGPEGVDQPGGNQMARTASLLLSFKLPEVFEQSGGAGWAPNDQKDLAARRQESSTENGTNRQETERPGGRQ